MCQDLLSPGVGIPAIMAHAGIVIHHGVIKVQQKQIRGDGVGKCRTVIAPVFIIPVSHGVMVGIGQRDGIDALVHLHKLMGIGADGPDAVLFGQVNIGGAHAVLRLRHQAAHHHIFPFPGKSAAAAEFREAERISTVLKGRNFLIQPLGSRGAQGLIVIAHAEIDLIDDFQQINFKLHSRKQRSLHNDSQLPIRT